ncbi:MAG: nitroreductase family protein [Phycisphaerae bacterium]|jgi:nitroreductase
MPAKMIPYRFTRQSATDMRTTAVRLVQQMNSRRSCRHFSGEPVDRSIIEQVIAVGHSAPSGANRKPWRYVAVDDPGLKREIREAAEREERKNYGGRMPQAWLDALEPLGTDASKPFLEVAPWLIVIFRIDWETIDGERVLNYYPVESTGLAAGMFLMACHQAGLATLTHTPSPMGFLRDLLGRPANEKPYLLIPVGYPAPDCQVPDITKKPLAAALQWNRG